MYRASVRAPTAFCGDCDALSNIHSLEITREAGSWSDGAVRDAFLDCGHTTRVVVTHWLARESRRWWVAQQQAQE